MEAALSRLRGARSQPSPEPRRELPVVAAKDLDAAVVDGNPAIVRGHPMVKRLASETCLKALAERLSGTTIEVAHKHRWVGRSKQIDAADYLSHVDRSHYYWRHFPLASVGMSPSLPKPGGYGTTYFDHGWIGPRNSVQTFHQDNHDELFVNHNLFAQVIGRKYVALASPGDSDFFRSLPLAKGDARHSTALPWDEATRQGCNTLAEATLEAGDLLYVPPRYWHFVRSYSTSMSISRWWFTTRIAELLYASELDVEIEQGSGHEEEWKEDLVEFGGASTLNEFLIKKPVMARLRFVLALTRFYGKGILDGEG